MIICLIVRHARKRYPNCLFNDPQHSWKCLRTQFFILAAPTAYNKTIYALATLSSILSSSQFLFSFFGTIAQIKHFTKLALVLHDRTIQHTLTTHLLHNHDLLSATLLQLTSLSARNINYLNLSPLSCLCCGCHTHFLHSSTYRFSSRRVPALTISLPVCKALSTQSLR